MCRSLLTNKTLTNARHVALNGPTIDGGWGHLLSEGLDDASPLTNVFFFFCGDEMRNSLTEQRHEHLS